MANSLQQELLKLYRPQERATSPLGRQASVSEIGEVVRDSDGRRLGRPASAREIQQVLRRVRSDR